MQLYKALQTPTLLDAMSRILLIENQTRLGVFMGMRLMDAGHDVGKVETPDLVAERLSSGPPDVIVFNTGLPAREKADFISSWREACPRVKILEVSENPLIIGRQTEDLERVGAPDAFLEIPFDFSDLIVAVDDLMAAKEQGAL
jgi:DNA-binding NtrC family response regulator